MEIIQYRVINTREPNGERVQCCDIGAMRRAHVHRSSTSPFATLTRHQIHIVWNCNSVKNNVKLFLIVLSPHFRHQRMHLRLAHCVHMVLVYCISIFLDKIYMFIGRIARVYAHTLASTIVNMIYLDSSSKHLIRTNFIIICDWLRLFTCLICTV